MGIGAIIGKEIEKEFLGIRRAANGFPLQRRSRASPHLDPMPALSQHGYASETANCAAPLCFGERRELHQQKSSWKLMRLPDPSASHCSLRVDAPSRSSATGRRRDRGSGGLPAARPHRAPAAPRELLGSEGDAHSGKGAAGDGRRRSQPRHRSGLRRALPAPPRAGRGPARCRVDARDPGEAMPVPEAEPWHWRKSGVSSSEMAVFQHAVISVL